MKNNFREMAAYSNLGTLLDNEVYYDPRYEKFAELIVKKCIEICEEGSLSQTTSAGAALMIKQHFKM